MKTKGKIIGVLNSKGGVGKSTLALHIGMALYHNRVFNSENKNNKVVLLDTDTPQYSLSNLRKSELDFLKANIDYAMQQKMKKIIVIHGVGAGILKSEALKLIQSYDRLRAEDASYHKYGKGATEVLIF